MLACLSTQTLVLPSWYRLIRVVPEKGPLNVCVCVYLSTKTKTTWYVIKTLY